MKVRGRSESIFIFQVSFSLYLPICALQLDNTVQRQA
jgi:hypothetical protein